MFANGLGPISNGSCEQSCGRFSYLWIPFEMALNSSLSFVEGVGRLLDAGFMVCK